MNFYKHLITIISFLIGLFLFNSCGPDEVTYTLSQDGFVKSHAYVNLGLPSGTLWATCNIGASSPEEYGDYFAWGEISGYNSGKRNFDWETYKYGTDLKVMTKYVPEGVTTYSSTVDNKSILESSDDAATCLWNNGWKIPSTEQFKELLDNTNQEGITMNNIKGVLFTSKNNAKCIFLPCAGDYAQTIYQYGSGRYWSCNIGNDYAHNAYYFQAAFGSSNYCGLGTQVRCTGYSIRPVCNSNSGTDEPSEDIDDDDEICSVCDGTGKCQKCEGSGKCTVCGGNYKYKDAYGNITVCPYCEYGKCIPCKGTGHCQNCHGSGKSPQS